MKYGLIGAKLSHSFSKEIHGHFFDYPYELLELSSEQLDVFLRERDFCAVNVTVPYKETVIPYLDEVDERAQAIGAVNTIVNRDGKLYGYNTDFDGLYALIRRNAIDLKDKKVLILGSGGTSKTAMAVARYVGCNEVLKVSRRAQKDCITYEQARENHTDTQVIINTTPCGMYPNGGVSPIDLTAFSHLENVVDVVYNPLRTKLVCDARRRNIPAAGGLYMLIAQAVAAAQHFVGAVVPQERVEELYRRMMAEENVVLIGMPASGKSTVGKRLAEMMERPFLDTDALIVEKCGKSIPDLFAQIGEGGFRAMETEIIREVSCKKGYVIATGGGVVLHSENTERLRGNGRIYFMDRSLDLLTATADRPLSATTAELQKRYDERYPIYCAVCDMRIEADASVDDVAKRIREDFLYEHFGD